MNVSSRLISLLSLSAALVALTACSKSDPHAGHDHSATAAKHEHEHKAPHGGTPVMLGKETYHLELVRDAAAGKLSVYVLDGEMENFIRIAAPSIEVVATVGGAKQTLTAAAIANPATGETAGNTSLFEAQADWLKTTSTFDGVVTKVEIRGTAFTAVDFNFPKGNEKE